MSDRDATEPADLEPEDHALVAKLRALPGEGREPDWAQLEREIARAVGTSVPVPWWRNRRRWLVPTAALAGVAVILVIVMRQHPAPVVAVEVRDAGAPAPIAEAAPPVAPSEDTTLWLDGQAVDVRDVDPTQLLLDDVDETDEVADDSGTLLPADDLGWIDSLDDHALDRAEHWLKKKGHTPG